MWVENRAPTFTNFCNVFLNSTYGYCTIAVLAGCYYMTKQLHCSGSFSLPVILYADIQLEDTFMQDLWDISLRFVYIVVTYT